MRPKRKRQKKSESLEKTQTLNNNFTYIAIRFILIGRFSIIRSMQLFQNVRASNKFFTYAFCFHLKHEIFCNLLLTLQKRMYKQKQQQNWNTQKFHLSENITKLVGLLL